MSTPYHPATESNTVQLALSEDKKIELFVQ